MAEAYRGRKSVLDSPFLTIEDGKAFEGRKDVFRGLRGGLSSSDVKGSMQG
jgi:hypothetical protein